MTRLPDWEDRLHAYLLTRTGLAHVFGTNDCCLFGADEVEAITGEDIAAEFRGRYTTELGAVRALRRYGAGSIAATIDTKLPRVESAFARRGDLAMVNDIVGIVIGADAIFISDVDGVSEFVRHPRADWSAAWSVG